MLAYRPRRASKRWLQDAPEYVLSVHDYGPSTCDRYTVCFGGSLWEPNMGRTIYYLAMSGAPFHPQGFCQWGEMNAYDRKAKKIRWLDLPEDCRRAVVQRATSDDTARAIPQGTRPDGRTAWIAQHRATDTCGWSDVVSELGSTIEYQTERDAIEAARFNESAWRLAGPPRL